MYENVYHLMFWYEFLIFIYLIVIYSIFFNYLTKVIHLCLNYFVFPVLSMESQQR